MIPIKGQVVIITGGASGFGRELALRCVDNLAHVVLGDLNLEALKGLADELNNKPRISNGLPNAIYSKCDVCKKQEFEALFKAAHKEFGYFTTLVNNAGITEKDPFADNVGDSWTKVIDIDLTAVILGTRLALEYMKRQAKRDYAIVNVASLAGIYPQAFQPVYAAAKAGVVNFSRSLKYLADEGIRVNAVCPSFVKTPLTTQLQTGGGVDLWVEIELVIDAFMMAIQDPNLAGELIRITPRYGIDIYRPTGKKANL